MAKLLWTPRRRSLTTQFVRTAQERLRLLDWTITIDFDTPAPKDSVATMNGAEGQRRATLRFGESFLACSAHDQRQTLVHELLHCHLFEVAFLGHTICDQLTSKPARLLGKKVINERVEWVTDALADVIVAQMGDLKVPADLP